MIKLAAIRIGWAIPTIFAILVLSFILVHSTPGDPVQALVGDFPTPPGYIEKIRAEFGLDQSIGTQLWLYLVNLLSGNLGFSFANRQPVLDLILARAQTTLLLMLPSLILASIVGVVTAVASARRPGGAFDGVITGLSLFGYSVPVFWLSQILITFFAIRLGWLPAQGFVSLREEATGFARVLDIMRHMVLPGFTIVIFYAAIIARVARASVLEVVSQDFVLTARAKGLSESKVMLKHILPNAMVPVVNVIGYNFGYSLTGAILVETVFSWPGLGSLFMTSIGNRDYPVLQGIFLFAGVAVIIANLITDIVCALIDPRVRRSHEANV
jgi:peptide/nickel transport system permease protein